MNFNWSLARVQSITNKMHDPDSSPDDQLERCDMSTELPNAQEETLTKFPARPATHHRDTTGMETPFQNKKFFVRDCTKLIL